MVRHFYVLVALLFSLSASAAVQTGGVPSVTLGGYGAVQGGNIIPGSDTGTFMLYAQSDSSVAGHLYPFYKNANLYQVTTGTTCLCSSLKWLESSTADKMQLMSDTATFANDALTGSLTAGKYQSGAAAKYLFVSQTAGNVWNVEQIRYSFTSLTWPGAQTSVNSGNFMVQLSCREY